MDSPALQVSPSITHMQQWRHGLNLFSFQYIYFLAVSCCSEVVFKTVKVWLGRNALFLVIEIALYSVCFVVTTFVYSAWPSLVSG